MREAGIDGETSCGEFFSYIQTHNGMPDNVNAENAKFVMMLILTSQANNHSINRHRDDMTPARIHDYENAFGDNENAFGDNCKHGPKMTITSAMGAAVATVDSQDPV